MKNTLNNLEVVDDVLWLNYKGYEIRIEKSKSHNNNNLVITVHPDTESDYTHKLEVENQQANKQKGHKMKISKVKVKKLLSDYWSCYKSYDKDTYNYVIENLNLSKDMTQLNHDNLISDIHNIIKGGK